MPRYTILIVDDTIGVGPFLDMELRLGRFRETCRANGYDSFETRAALTATAAIQQIQEDPPNVVVIDLDIHFPRAREKSSSGLEVARYLRSTHPAIPFVFCSVNTDDRMLLGMIGSVAYRADSWIDKSPPPLEDPEAEDRMYEPAMLQRVLTALLEGRIPEGDRFDSDDAKLITDLVPSAQDWMLLRALYVNISVPGEESLREARATLEDLGLSSDELPQPDARTKRVSGQMNKFCAARNEAMNALHARLAVRNPPRAAGGQVYRSLAASLQAQALTFTEPGVTEVEHALSELGVPGFSELIEARSKRDR